MILSVYILHKEIQIYIDIPIYRYIHTHTYYINHSNFVHMHTSNDQWQLFLAGGIMGYFYFLLQAFIYSSI